MQLVPRIVLQLVRLIITLLIPDPDIRLQSGRGKNVHNAGIHSPIIMIRLLTLHNGFARYGDSVITKVFYLILWDNHILPNIFNALMFGPDIKI